MATLPESSAQPWFWLERTGAPATKDATLFDVMKGMNWGPCRDQVLSVAGTSLFMVGSDRAGNLRLLRRGAFLAMLPISATLAGSYAIFRGIRSGPYVLHGGPFTYTVEIEK